MPLPLGFWRLGLSRDAYDACNASGTGGKGGGAAWNSSRLGWLPRSWPEQAESQAAVRWLIFPLSIEPASGQLVVVFIYYPFRAEVTLK